MKEGARTGRTSSHCYRTLDTRWVGEGGVKWRLVLRVKMMVGVMLMAMLAGGAVWEE